MRAQLRTAAIAAGLSVLIAGAVNLLLLGIAYAIGGPIIVTVQDRTQPVGIGEVVTVTILAAIVAAAGSAVLARWSWGLRVVLIAGIVITLLSLGAVLGASTLTGAITLGLMHVVTGTTVIVVNVILQSRRVRAAQPTR